MYTEPKSTTGVLLMAYGSPGHISDVEEYLKYIKGGASISPELVSMIQDRYRSVGGKTPLLEITLGQADALQKLFDQNGQKNFKVYVGMKHWHPFIKDTVKRMVEDGVCDIIAIPLVPHYSVISTGGYQRALDEALRKVPHAISVTFIKNWHMHPRLIDCILEQIRDGFKKFPEHEKVHLVFTAHSLPAKILAEGDPYHSMLQETSRMLARVLETDSWIFSFQSAGHTGEKWLGPDILDSLQKLSQEGCRNILICPIGFVSDHLEILYDIDVMCQNFARSHSLIVHRTESRNIHPLFIQALYDIVIAQGEQ